MFLFISAKHKTCLGRCQKFTDFFETQHFASTCFGKYTKINRLFYCTASVTTDFTNLTWSVNKNQLDGGTAKTSITFPALGWISKLKTGCVIAQRLCYELFLF